MKRIHNFLDFKNINESNDINREIRDELEVRISPSTGKIPQSEIFEIAEMYDRDIEEIATLAFSLEAEYTEKRKEEEKEEVEHIAEIAMIYCNFLKNRSIECFKEQLSFVLENIVLEYTSENKVINQIRTLYNQFKDIEIDDISRPHLPTVLFNKIDDLIKFKPDITSEEIYNDLEKDFNFHIISKQVALKLIEEYI